MQRPQTLTHWDGPNIELKCQSVQSLYGVWPLTASMEVKNIHHISLHISNSSNLIFVKIEMQLCIIFDLIVHT